MLMLINKYFFQRIVSERKLLPGTVRRGEPARTVIICRVADGELVIE
jgi:hypothetical protein